MMVKSAVPASVARADNARARGGGRAPQGKGSAQRHRRGGGDDEPEDWRVPGVETGVDGTKLDDLLSRIDEVAPGNDD